MPDYRVPRFQVPTRRQQLGFIRPGGGEVVRAVRNCTDLLG